MDRESITSRTGALFTAAIFLLQMYAVAPSYAEPRRIESQSSGHDSYRSIALPEKDRLIRVSVVQLLAGEDVVGVIVAYDDAATKRAADYLEFYNNVGALLAVSWFDEFGIERLAVDRALTEHTDKLEGVFVILVTEQSV